MADEYDEEYSYEEIEEWAEEYESDDDVPAAAAAAAGRTAPPAARSRLAPSQKAPRQAFGTPPPGAKASPSRTPGARRGDGASQGRAAAASPYGDRSSPASRSTPVGRQQAPARRTPGARGDDARAAPSPQSSAVTQGDLIAIYRKANAELKKQMYNNSNTQYVTQLENEIKTKDMSLAKLAEEVRTLKKVQLQQEKALKQDQAARKERSAADAYEADLRVLREKLKRSQERRQEERQVMRGLQAQVEKLEERSVRKPVSKAAEATDRKRSSADKALRQQEEQISELERKVRILTTAKATEARRFEHDIAELKREGAKLRSEIELLQDNIKEKDTIIRRNQIQMREMEKRQKEHKVRATDRSRANRVLKSQVTAGATRTTAPGDAEPAPAVQLDYGSGERGKGKKEKTSAKAAPPAGAKTPEKKATPTKSASGTPARASIASPTRRSRSRPTPVDTSSASNATRAERQQFSPSGPAVVDHEGRSAIASRGRVASPHVYGRTGVRAESTSPVRSPARERHAGEEDEDDDEDDARAHADGQEQRRRRLEAAGPAPTVPVASRGHASDSDASESDEDALLRNESRGSSRAAARPTTSKASSRRIRVAEDPEVLEAESVRTSSSRGSSHSRSSRPGSGEQPVARPMTSASRARGAVRDDEMDALSSSSIEEDIEMDVPYASSRPMTSHSRTMSRQASTRGSGRPVTRKSERSMQSGMDSEATQLVAEDFEGQPARGANAQSDDEDALLRDERRDF